MKKIILFITISVCCTAHTRSDAQVKNIVLVHGAFADGSGWKSVFTILKSRGYNVSIVGNPDISVEEDVAATRRVLQLQKGPVILVGHSYGGAVVTIAGTAENVAGLVYVSAFAPDEGETLGGLAGKYPADPMNGILPPRDGFLWYDAAKFHSGFCADLPEKESEFMSASQVPVAASVFSYVFTREIAWKTKPSWHVVGTEDHSLSPALERYMGKRTGGTVTEIKGSHVLFISHAREVADIIDKAAKSVDKRK
ncbi:MAG: alpha/beta hydrolase [Bacteroidota bacterium]